MSHSARSLAPLRAHACVPLAQVIENVGLVTQVREVSQVTGGIVHQAEANPLVEVVFKVEVFAPALRTVMRVRVLDQSATAGVRCTLGFFDDIFVGLDYMPKKLLVFDQAAACWTTSSKGKPLRNGAFVNVLVLGVHYYNTYRSSPDAPPPRVGDDGSGVDHRASARPMIVVAGMNRQGLGLDSWWGLQSDSEDEDDSAGAGGAGGVLGGAAQLRDLIGDMPQGNAQDAADNDTGDGGVDDDECEDDVLYFDGEAGEGDAKNDADD